MALAGSCPGMVFVQVGTGIPSGFYTLAGTILGGVAWSGILGPAITARTKKTPIENPDTKPAKLAIYEHLGISRSSAAVGVAVSFAVIVALISLFIPPQTQGLVTPITGGLLIAGAQLVSIIARSKLLGTSTSFEEVGGFIWRLIRGRGSNTPKPSSYGATVLTGGMVVGAFLVPLITPFVTRSPVPPPLIWDLIQPARAVLGGVLLAIGSRMGGGCTSGHGISGISLLSVSSFISVAAMFGGGMAVATLFGL